MANWDGWIGCELVQHDMLTAATLDRFRATIDSHATGNLAAQAIHWCLCLPDTPTAALGGDGHPRRTDDPDSFMPPIALPRRMWAASDVHFHAPIRTGASIERRSVVAAINEKTGNSGPLVFVEIDHETSADGILAVSERQAIVYRAPTSAAAPVLSAPDAVEPDLNQWEWHRPLVPCEAMLFRYSALTFNSHRIHYDLPYAVNEEGYRGLVVHGPLTATLLLDLAQRERGSNALTRLTFRAQAPAFAGERLHLVGRSTESGWELAAIGADGRTIMGATAG